MANEFESDVVQPKKKSYDISAVMRYSVFVLFILIGIFSLFIIFGGVESQRVLIDKNPVEGINDGWYYYGENFQKIYIDTLPAKISEKDFPSQKFKIYHEAPAFCRENCYFTFYSHHQSVKVYADDSLIFSFSNKTFPKNLRTYRAFYHLIKSPSLTLPNGENIKEISIEVEPSLSAKKGEFSVVEIGTEFSIINELLLARHNRIVLAAVIFIAGLFLLIYSQIFKKVNTDSSMFYLSILLILVSLWQLEESRFLQFIIPYQPIHWFLEYAIQPLILLAAFMFIRENSTTKKEKTLIILFATDCTAIVMTFVLQIFGIMAMTENIVLIQICFIFSCIYIFVLINRDFKFKTVFSRIIFSASIFIGAVSFLLALLFSGNEYFQVSNLTFIGFGFMFIALSSIVGRRILEQITKVQLANQYESLSQIDSLSGLMNRNSWYHFTEEIEKQEKKYDDCCLILFEMSNLRNINESFGFLCGDNVIKMISGFLKRAATENCTLYRIKGHLFACFCNGVSSDDVEKILSKFNRYVINQYEFNFTVTVACGKSFFVPKMSADFFLAQDEAMKQIEEQRKLFKIETLD